MINVKVNGKNYSYEKAVKYDKIAADAFGADNEMLLAKVDGKLYELWKTVKEDCEIEFLDIGTKDGRMTYERGLIFLFIKSVHDEYNHDEVNRVYCDFSIGNGLYCEISGNAEVNAEFVDKIKSRMDELISKNILFEKHTITTKDAIERFKENGLSDKEHLFKYRRVSETNIYELGNYTDYYYGYMPPRTGIIKSYDLIPYEGGIMLVLPEKGKGLSISKPSWTPSEKLFKTMLLSNEWGRQMEVDNVGELNDMISRGNTGDLILVAEALQERRIGAIAEMIAAKPDVKFVMIAGPSSSGKTTFSHRLSIELMVNGLRPHPISCDDYFLPRELTPKDENGDYDFECLEALDVEQFNKDMTDLLNGKEVPMPTYNFKTGKREYRGNTLKLGKNDILVIEGIHGLNDRFSYSLAKENKFRIYISALTQLNIDDHNRIHTTDGRLLRRMVRDARTRGNSADDTLSRWASVRRGEEKTIFTFQESADVMFNSALIYELSVLKPYAEPLLFGIEKGSPNYAEANRLLKFLDYFLTIPADNIPKNSLVREFIGGGCFGL